MIRSLSRIGWLVLAMGLNGKELGAENAAYSGVQLPTGARVVNDPALGTVRSISGGNLSATLEQDDRFRALQAAQQDGAIAIAFLKSVEPLLKLQDVSAELRETGTTRDDLGMAHVIYAQVYLGIPIWASQIRVHLDRGKHVNGLEAHYIPTPTGLSVTANWSEVRALDKAALTVGASDCARCQVEKVIWTSTSDAKPRLAFMVLVVQTLRQQWRLFIDASDGEILEQLPTTASSTR